MAESQRRLKIVADFLDRVSAPARRARAELAGLRKEAGKTDRATAKSGGAASSVIRTVLSLPGRLAAGALGAIKGMVSSVFRLVTGVAQVGFVLGGLALGGLLATLKSVSAEVGQIARRASALGVPAKLMLEFGDAAARAGVGSSQLQNALGIAARRLDEVARRGGGQAAQALSVLGVRVRDATGELRPLAELLPEISDGLAQIQDKTLRRDLARNIFGQSDPLTIGFLGQGGGALRAAQAEIRAVVGELSEEQIGNIEKLDVAFKLFFRSVVGGGRQLVAQLAPFVTEALKKITAAVAALPEIVSNAVNLVHDALRNEGEIGQEARRILSALFANVVKTSVVALEEGAVILLEVGITLATTGIALLFDTIGPVVTNRVKRLFNEGITAGADALLSTVGSAILGKEVANGARAVLQVARDVIQQNLRNEPIIDSQDVSLAFRKAFQGVSGSFVGGRVQESIATMRDGLAEFFATIEEGVGVTGVFARKLADVNVSVDGNAFGRGAEKITLWGQALDGVRASISKVTDEFKGFTNKALTVFTLGQQVGDAMVGTFVNEFPNAVLAATRSIQSFGDIVKSVLKNILDAVNQVVLRFLALRIVSAIGSALPTPAATEAPSVFGPPAPAGAPILGPPGPLGFSFAGAAPGASSSAFHATITIINNFAGSDRKTVVDATMQASRQAAQQLLDTLQRSPSLKSRLKEMAGGR